MTLTFVTFDCELPLCGYLLHLIVFDLYMTLTFVTFDFVLEIYFVCQLYYLVNMKKKFYNA